jgi:hypothetical protein
MNPKRQNQQNMSDHLVNSAATSVYYKKQAKETVNKMALIADDAEEKAAHAELMKTWRAQSQKQSRHLGEASYARTWLKNNGRELNPAFLCFHYTYMRPLLDPVPENALNLD